MIFSSILSNIRKNGNYGLGWLRKIYSNILFFSTNHKYIYKITHIFEKNPLFISYFINWIGLGFALFYDFTPLFLLLFFFINVVIFYELFYDFFELKKSYVSFLCFLWLSICFAGYFYTFTILYKGLPQPIYLRDISIISQYRYLLLVVLTFGFVFVYSLKHKSERLTIVYNVFNFPLLKEEIKNILYFWHENIWAPLFITILSVLKKNIFFCVIFIILHFIIFIVLRGVLIYVFINFVFFGGDVRLLLYMSPLSLIIFCLMFIDYYFFWFFKSNIHYLNDILTVKMLSPAISRRQNILFVNTSQFSFELTSYGKDQGFSEQKTYILQELWFEYGRIDAIFSLYFKYVKLIFIFFFFIQVFSWIYLVYYFFIFPFINAVNIPPFFKRFPFGSYRLMRQPYDARAAETEGSYNPGHLAIVDSAVRNPDNSTEILYGGQLTSGPATTKNPSHKLANVNLKGKNQDQNYVPPVRADTYVNENYVHGPITGSQKYMDDNKSNHMKHLPQVDET